MQDIVKALRKITYEIDNDDNDCVWESVGDCSYECTKKTGSCKQASDYKYYIKQYKNPIGSTNVELIENETGKMKKKLYNSDWMDIKDACKGYGTTIVFIDEDDSFEIVL